VGAPSSSKATERGGPEISCTESPCCSSRPRTSRVSLRGVAMVSRVSYRSRFTSKSCAAFSRRSSIVLGRNAAGISSVPISSKKSSTTKPLLSFPSWSPTGKPVVLSPRPWGDITPKLSRVSFEGCISIHPRPGRGPLRRRINPIMIRTGTLRPPDSVSHRPAPGFGPDGCSGSFRSRPRRLSRRAG